MRQNEGVHEFYDPETSTKKKGRQINVKTRSQREESCISKSTDLINAFIVHDNAKKCETRRFKNTLKSDSILDSKVSPNSIMENLLE